jgi:LysM repeat protein
MIQRIPLIIVAVIAAILLAYCNLNRNVALINISADTPPPYSADQVIKIRYVIKNTGGRAIGGTASVTSDKSMVLCPGLNTVGDFDNSLDRGEEIVCTGDYPVKAAEIQAGGVPVNASAAIGGVTSSPVSVSLPLGPYTLLSLLKLTTSANPSTYGQAGQQITFSYVILNTGAGNLGPTQFTVSDNLFGTAPFNCGPANTVLAPNATVACTAPNPYTITQNDMTAVSITNIATAFANGVGQSPTASTTINRSMTTLALTTSANPSTYSQAGQTITFSYVIKNIHTGNLGPAQFTVKDNLISPTPFNCGPANTTLAPNTTVTCNAPTPYTVTQNDTTAVSITNIATAFDGGGGSSAPASTTITRTNDTQHRVAEGEWLWQIARCYGVNPNTLVADNLSQVPNPRMLQPGTLVIVRNPGTYSKYYGPPCVEKYPVQAGDTWSSIAQKYSADPVILQMANSSKTLSPGTIVYVPRNSASGNTTPPTQVKALALTATASPTIYDQAGQVITFTYVIRNSGNTSLGPDQFRVSDSLISAAPFNCGPANTTLAPNTTTTCTATYTITQNDTTAVSVTNIATAAGGGAGPSPSASATVNKGVRSLSLTTTANPTTYNQAGQAITFTYVIRNSGTVSLGPAQFMISDRLISATPFNCGAANTTLAPTATVTCTAPYTITQNDMTAVSVTNIATASGGGAGPSPSASATVTRQ